MRGRTIKMSEFVLPAILVVMLGMDEVHVQAMIHLSRLNADLQGRITYSTSSMIDAFLQNARARVNSIHSEGDTLSAMCFFLNLS
jgi:hypothetical protein